MEKFEKLMDQIKDNRDLDWDMDRLCMKIPFDDFLPALYLGQAFIGEAGSYEYVLAAYGLKWYFEGKVRAKAYDYVTREGFDQEGLVLRMDREANYPVKSEEDLASFILETGDGNLKVSQEAMEDYVRENPEAYEALEVGILEEGLAYLKEEGYVTEDGSGMLLTDKGQDQVNKVLGFSNYIVNYSDRFDEEEGDFAWSELILAAAIMGKGDRLLGEFAKVMDKKRFYKAIQGFLDSARSIHAVYEKGDHYKLA